MRPPTVSVVIPKLNEGQNIPSVFGRIPEEIHTAGLRVTEINNYEYSRIHEVGNLDAVRAHLRVVRTISAERRGGGRGAAPAPAANGESFPTEESVG